MDATLAMFDDQANAAGPLNDTLLIITSDHWEAFGEQGPYLHNASLYDTHLHVPLCLHHSDRAAVTVDIVGTRDVFGRLRALASGSDLSDTILDAYRRAQRPIAIAEDFHHNRRPDARPLDDLDARVRALPVSALVRKAIHAQWSRRLPARRANGCPVMVPARTRGGR